MIVIEIRRKKADYLVHINRYLFMIFRFFTAFCKGEKKTAADKKEIVRITFVSVYDHELSYKPVSAILLELRSLSENFFKQDRYGAFAAEFPDRVSEIGSLVGRIRSGILQYLEHFLQIFMKFIRKDPVFAFAMLRVIE